MDKKPQQNLNDLKAFIKTATPEELQYELDRYCGPHNMLLRNRKYNYEACEALYRLLSYALATEIVDAFLSGDYLETK